MAIGSSQLAHSFSGWMNLDRVSRPNGRNAFIRFRITRPSGQRGCKPSRPGVAFCLLLLAAGFARAQTPGEHATLVDGTGSYSRSISTDSEAAQLYFDQGLRLAWAYYFPEALASFREADRLAPSEPMIHWGMALAIAPNPNSRRAGRPDDPAGEGLETIRRALELVDDAAPPIERALIEALYVRYDADTYPQRDERDRAYHERTRRLLEAYPEDPDVAALFADAFMTLHPWEYWEKDGAPSAGTAEVATALERSMRLVPSHPGTHHLYLHLYEASTRPERAIAVANRLEALMPDAGHVVHMPSHIYIRVGNYADAVAQNRRSVQADERFMAAWGDRDLPFVTSLPMSHVFHAWHAYDFMAYAAMQMGNYAESLQAARAALETARRFSGDGSCAGDRNSVSLWFVERAFGKWDTLLSAVDEAPDEQCARLKGMWHYMRGSALTGLSRLREARQELAALRNFIDSHDPNNGELLVASASLEGEIEQADGDPEAAVPAFRRAVALEDALPYTEPPGWPLPMRRFLGAALIEADRAAEAEAVYVRDLAWNQNNGWSLYGLWQSLRSQGKAGEAEAVRIELDKAWQHADVRLGASRY
ncbi:MAG: hypothetical protein JXB36_05640 [Gammaproteobacteria bacterium]|nr:hypothetical protein [Gammaproteobacteria bacterium]